MPLSECVLGESFRDVDIDHTAFEMLLKTGERKSIEITYKMSKVICKGNMWINGGAKKSKKRKLHLDAKVLSLAPMSSSMDQSIAFDRISEVPFYCLWMCMHVSVLICLVFLCILFLKELKDFSFCETPKNKSWYHGNGPKVTYYWKWMWFTRIQRKKKATALGLY